MSGDLLALASKYVSLTGEIEDVRRAMIACLANGSAPPEAELKSNPSRPVRPSGGSKPTKALTNTQPAKSQHPNAVKAQAVDERIIGLLKDRPGLKTNEIAEATASKSSTTVQRLQRLMERGEVSRDSQGAYALPA